MAETETLTIFLEKRPRGDVGTSRDRDFETETTTLGVRFGFGIDSLCNALSRGDSAAATWRTRRGLNGFIAHDNVSVGVARTR